MIKVPPEVDRLMWAVAENPAPQALDEFGVRHPEFRQELLRRIEMVRNLRHQVTAPNIPRDRIPKFEPKSLSPQGIPRGLGAAIALACAALAIAAFTVFTAARPTHPPSLPIVVKDGPFDVPAITYRPAPPPRAETPILIRPSAPLVTPPPEPVVEKRRDLDVKNVDLVDALNLITSGTNYKLEIGPGFVNQKITLSFHGETTMEMLHDMAKEYAFTVSDEGDGHILVLPVPDTDPADPSGKGSKRLVGP